MASKTADAVKLVLRLPKPLHKQLRQRAKLNDVSLNTEIVNQLAGAEAATSRRIMRSRSRCSEKRAGGRALRRSSMFCNSRRNLPKSLLQASTSRQPKKTSACAIG